MTEHAVTRALIDRAPINLAYVDVNRCYRYVNDAYVRRLGRPRDTIIGRGVPEVVGEAAYESVRSWLDRVFSGERLTLEQAVPYRDLGTRFITVEAEPDFGADGTVIGAVFAFRDDTARHAVEQLLQESERRRSIALDAARLGSWTLDLRSFELTSSSNCHANFGRGPDDPFTYADLIEAIHPEDRESMQDAVRRAIATGTDYRAEYRVIWPDGSEHWVGALGRVSHDASGTPAMMDGITIDMTRRKQLEESLRAQAEILREADRRKDEFLAMLAHELRTPLQPLTTGLELLRLGKTNPAVIDDAERVMSRQVKLLTRLVDDLLDLSRISQGKISLQREAIDVANVVNEAIEMSRPIVAARKHSLTVNVAGSLPYVGDAARLTQVVANLLHNAAKYTPSGGQLAVDAHHDAGTIVIEVHDNGLGIAPELLPTVFDMFAQGELGHGALGGGLGIGLSLVRQLVELHGGTVHAASAGKNHGSTFTVVLPSA